MRQHDPLHVLALFNPYADRRELTAEDEALLERIMATPIVATSTRRARRRWLIAGAATAVALTTAAFVVVQRERASNPTTIVCYAAADLGSDRAVVPAAADPVAACAVPWSDGTLSDQGPPPLAACVNDAGVAAVVPGETSVCSLLGLAELVAGRSGEQQAIVDLQDRMADVFGRACYRQDDAIAKAQELLDESGLDGWTVRLAEPFPPGMECGGGGPLADAKTVIVSGVRPAP